MDTEDFSDDPEWEYGFKLDGYDTVYSRIFGLRFTSFASAVHTADKNWTTSVEYFRHPKGSDRDDDWQPICKHGYGPGDHHYESGYCRAE